MRTTKRSDHLLQLTRFASWFPVNCYLVREEDGFTLVDTGIVGSAQSILDAARSAGAPIVRIALTHAHNDHAGSLAALRAALPGVEVAMSAREARLLAGDRSLNPDEPHDRSVGMYVRSKEPPTRLLAPGDHVGSLRVVAAPGHTPGQIAFYDERDGTLIAGDAFQTRGGIAVAGVIRPTFPFPAIGTWNRTIALESARQLRALRPAILAVGHGDPPVAPLAAMDDAIAVATDARDARTAKASSRPRSRSARLVRTVTRAVIGTNVALYRRTGGRFLGRMGRSPILLLTTTGRKSGQEYTTPLLYLKDGDRYVIVASAGGAPKDPQWWPNLKHTPDARIEVGRETIPVHAAQASDEEKRRLWPLLVAMYPAFAAYQRRATRDIPVVILHPTENRTLPTESGAKASAT